MTARSVATMGVAATCLALAGCDVTSVAQPPTGAPATRGILMVDTDDGYSSTNVAFLGWDGSSSPSLVSSGQTAAGLSAALSGDVVLPSEAPRFSGEAVLIDQTLGVVTWLDPQTAKVRAQLPVGDGFFADPFDYFEVSTEKAYVLRYGKNADPSAAPDNVGGDIVVIDPRVPVVIARIALDAFTPGAYGAYPVRFLRSSRDGAVLVILQAFTTPSYCQALDSVVATVDTATDSVVGTASLPGLKNCAAATRLDGDRFVVGCTGLLPLFGCTTQGGVGIVVMHDQAGVVTEDHRYDVAGEPLSLGVLDAASADLVVFGTLGDRDTGVPDRWQTLDVADAAAHPQVLAEGAPIMLGDVACNRDLGFCYGADAEHKTVRRFDLRGGALVEGAATGFTDPYGLAPRTFGRR